MKAHVPFVYLKERKEDKKGEKMELQHLEACTTMKKPERVDYNGVVVLPWALWRFGSVVDKESLAPQCYPQHCSATNNVRRG